MSELPPASPFQSPQQGRLGIMHLLVWIACVAVCFALSRGSPSFGRVEPSIFWTVVRGMWSVVLGTGLGGLVLAVARWWRGTRFPVHPGEWLWLSDGIVAAASTLALAMLALAWRFAVERDSQESAPDGFFGLASLAYLAVYAVQVVALMVPAILIRPLRWRAFMATATLAAILACCTLPFPDVVLQRSTTPLGLRIRLVVATSGHLLTSGLLLVVLVLDAAERKRYPWSHWTGVALNYSSLVVSMVSVVGTLMSMSDEA
jgi:hypothetical protein